MWDVDSYVVIDIDISRIGDGDGDGDVDRECYALNWG